MKLLVLTQVVDKNDSFLGFFHTWVEVFAKNFEYITVICLKEGVHNLPENVQVLSLGKEQGVSRFTYLKRFYSYIWKYHREYDAVYVHMNQEYVLLGGWLWRLMGKRVTMWRNHFAGSFLTDTASLFCHKVFCTSHYSYTAKYKKTVFMPVGVPEDKFFPSESESIPSSILSFVRISPSKKIEQLIEALELLKKKGVAFTATICGDATMELKDYEAKLHKQVKDLGLENQVLFRSGVLYEEAPKLYHEHEISVNQSPSGMYDKTLFEAMLCGKLVLSCNENLRGEIDDMFLFNENDVTGLADKLTYLLALKGEERSMQGKQLAKYAKDNHSLSHLAVRMRKELDTM
ncbi:MAG: Glycosyltransferase [Parcubacteria group bacterium GW2011_GWD2_42_14]|nr:MAG: Glycosyltransferase [Parcubacteria group bacterium GW2011_GWD2_42_14]